MSKLTNDSDVTEMFGGVLGMAVLGFVLIGGPAVILFAISALLVATFGAMGVAVIVTWLLTGIVCMCVSGIKKGFANWAGYTVGTVIWGAVLFIVIGGPFAFISNMMQGSSSSQEYRPYKSVVDDVERQQAKFKYIGDGDGF